MKIEIELPESGLTIYMALTKKKGKNKEIGLYIEEADIKDGEKVPELAKRLYHLLNEKD